jgi:SPP1 gp7 family putative phage head morphogenesis protein
MGILGKLFGKPKQKYETLGNTEAVCPYCAKPLEKMPGRKTKCPFCANFMYVRTRPADKKRVIVTEQDAAKINEQWMVENGSVVNQSSARPYEGPPMVKAIKYAQERGAQMVTKYELTPDSAGRLAQIVSDGIKNKRGIGGLASDIRKEFPGMTAERARLIAQSKTTYVLSQASLDSMREMGIEGKEWVTAGDDRVCEICLGNKAVGVIPIDKAFPSGHMHPPGCENCRCALAPAILSRQD